MKKYYSFTSANGVNKINVAMWLPKEAPKAIVQISHGMIEHIERYDEFAEYLAENNYVVVANDHLGHGKSVSSPEEYGYFGEGDGSRNVTRDLHTVTSNIKKLYPNLPVILLGHSMGSFIARRYITKYADEIDGVILTGTGNFSAVELAFGKLLVNTIGLIRGNKYRSTIANAAVFGLYNIKVKNKRTKKDWLSTDTKTVDDYIKDDKCNFIFTINGIKVLLNTLSYIEKSKNIEKIPKDLPIAMFSGKNDPVGHYGKSVKALFDIYLKHNLTKVSMKLYENKRHELLNEVGKLEFYEELRKWIEENGQK